jgi:hypothetical protein
MSRMRLLVVALALIVTVSLVSVSASLSRGDKVGAPVGAPIGSEITISPAERQFLENAEATTGGRVQFSGKVFLLSSRGTKAMYQLERKDGGACYAVGKTIPTFSSGRLGAFVCSENFPSRETLLDFSTVEISESTGGEPLFVDIQGIATNRVQSVRALSADGEVLAEESVKNGVYWVNLSEGQRAARIVAVDGTGTAVGANPR